MYCSNFKFVEIILLKSFTVSKIFWNKKLNLSLALTFKSGDYQMYRNKE